MIVGSRPFSNETPARTPKLEVVQFLFKYIGMVCCFIVGKDAIGLFHNHLPTVLAYNNPTYGADQGYNKNAATVGKSQAVMPTAKQYQHNNK
jgi:hypothetical protein